MSRSEDSAIAEAAADWIVQLSADTAAERETARAGFEAWKRAHPRHAEIAAEMEGFVDQTRHLRGSAADTSAAHAALGAVLPPARRPTRPTRRLGGLLVLALGITLGSAVWLPAAQPRQWLADLRTGSGEQRSEQLADGTTLTLSSASAVDYRLSPDLRRVELLAGELMLDVAKDAHRPLVVDTPQGRIRALGTRFIVRREADATVLTMLESSTAVSLAQGQTETVVAAGQRVRLSAGGLQRLAAINPGLTEDAFRQRRLLVQDRPLNEVLDELARQRPGLLRYDAAALASIRVTAVLPLDDTDRALQMLVLSFPQLRLHALTPWLSWVELVRSAPTR